MRRLLTLAPVLLAWLTLPGVAATEAHANPQALPAVEGTTAVSGPAKAVAPDSPQVVFEGGQLTIHAVNMPLKELLAKIGALTGVTIDLPDGTGAEALPNIRLGPGPAREVVASLLSDLNFDYLIQESEIDPGKLKSVLIMARARKETGPAIQDAPAQAARTSYPAVTSPVRTDEVSSVAKEHEKAPDANVPNDSPLPARDQSELTASRVDKPEVVRPAPLPPSALTSENMSQQLQQMYQQRMQMIQQGRQSGSR